MLITWRLKEPGARHDDIIKWKYFPRYWPFVREIHRSPVNSLHKGQWRGTLMFSLICLWLNGWVNNREAGDFRRCRAHYDVNVMAPWYNSKFVQHLEWSGLKHDQPITTKDHYKMSLNYEFDWSIVNWTGAWTWTISSHGTDLFWPDFFGFSTRKRDHQQPAFEKYGCHIEHQLKQVKYTTVKHLRIHIIFSPMWINLFISEFFITLYNVFIWRFYNWNMVTLKGHHHLGIC